MTLHDIASQLHDLSVDGCFNGEHFTRAGLETAIRMWMRNPEHNKIKNRYVLEISLQDGRWLMTIDKISDSADGYDYYIPDTRDEEGRLWDLLSA